MTMARVVAALGGLFFVVAGVWAFVHPPSFSEVVAPFPPLNVHYLRDAGAFQIGLGVALLLALVRADALLVALVAVGAASLFHLASHVIDIDRGGQPVRDLVSLAVLAGVLLLAAAVRWREAAR
jgi:uncharacterized membrane protein